MKIIEKKSDPDTFQKHLDGIKNFDLRGDDDNAQPNDILYLREFDRETKKYSGRTIRVLILWVLRGPVFGKLAEGDCIMSLHPDMIKREGEFYGRKAMTNG